MILTPTLDWGEHVLQMLNKVQKRLSAFSALKKQQPSNVLLTMYSHFIRPLLEYADVVWDNLPQALIDSIEQIQYQALLVVSGTMHGTSSAKLRELYGLPALETRRKLHRMCLLFKMINNLEVPVYLKNLIDQNHLRKSDRLKSFEPPKATSNNSAFLNAFLFKSINEWNALPKNIRTASSLHIFKTGFLKFHNVKPKKFLSPLLPRSKEILLNSFRLGVSGLNEDMHRHGFPTPPRCPCGRYPETQAHFFFSCSLHTDARKTLFESINRLLKPKSDLSKFNQTDGLALLLYAESKKLRSDATQKQIFLNVVDFVKASNRITL